MKAVAFLEGFLLLLFFLVPIPYCWNTFLISCYNNLIYFIFNSFFLFLGAFKIEIDKRRGYIIIDLALGVPVPIVLMDDRKSPHFGK